MAESPDVAMGHAATTGRPRSTTVRLMARLDVKGPNLIKGVQFDGHRVLGVPEEFAETYAREGIDELIFQDTVASLYERNSLHEIVRRTAERVFIPMTVAGGLRTLDDIAKCLRAGADKVAINTAAIARPELLAEASRTFGAQSVVASLEVYRYADGRCGVWTDYGRQETGVDAFEWAERVVDFGVGEIMLTSINREGTGRGFDLDLIAQVARRVPVPVIAVGGAGNKDHLVTAVATGCADAVAAASIFHYAYAQPVERPHMSFAERRLRMGEHIDSGNIDFLNAGYGSYRAIPVTPTRIPEAKRHLEAGGVPTRPVDPAAVRSQQEANR